MEERVNNRLSVSPQLYYRWAFVHFWLVAAVGLVLRTHYLWPFQDFKVPHWLHAHSHVAFLGWIFFVLIGAMLRYFPEFLAFTRRQQQWLFYLLLISVWGMLFTFIWQGYGLFSITFSTLHMALGIWIAIRFFKKSRGNSQLSVQMMRWALVFMLLSSAGPLVLGPLSAMGLKTSKWYQLSIYFPVFANGTP